MELGHATVQAVLDKLYIMIVKPTKLPMTRSLATVTEVQVIQNLVSHVLWESFLVQCTVSVTRNWLEFQNDALTQIYLAYCSRGNMHTGGCLTNFYLEMGEKQRFGPHSVGGPREASTFKGIFGIFNE